MRGIFFTIITLISFNAFCQNATNTFYVVPPFIGQSFQDENNLDAIDEFFAQNNMFISQLPNSDKLTYTYAIDIAMIGWDVDKKIIGIYGIYFNSDNLDYLKYIPIPVAKDTVVIVYNKIMPEAFDGLDNINNLFIANVPLVSLQSVPAPSILKDREDINVCEEFKGCMDSVLNQRAVFVASGQMLRAFLKENPEYAAAVDIKKLNNGKKNIIRPLYFAFNKDYAETLEFSQTFIQLTQLLQSLKSF